MNCEPPTLDLVESFTCSGERRLSALTSRAVSTVSRRGKPTDCVTQKSTLETQLVQKDLGAGESTACACACQALKQQIWHALVSCYNSSPYAGATGVAWFRVWMYPSLRSTKIYLTLLQNSCRYCCKFHTSFVCELMSFRSRHF